MKERPVLMKGPLVLQTLARIKTNTRRLSGLDEINEEPDEWTFEELKSGFARFSKDAGGAYLNKEIQCPYGVIGDRLWVREAWRLFARWDECSAGELSKTFRDVANFPICFETDEVERNVKTTDFKWGRYRHARFMPRWASRLTLEITNIRVERLCDISEVDALAEGCGWRFCQTCNESGEWAEGEICEDCAGIGGHSSSSEFRTLWQSINGPDSWGLNPYVWALTFKVVQP